MAAEFLIAKFTIEKDDLDSKISSGQRSSVSLDAFGQGQAAWRHKSKENAFIGGQTKKEILKVC